MTAMMNSMNSPPDNASGNVLRLRMGRSQALCRHQPQWLAERAAACPGSLHAPSFAPSPSAGGSHEQQSGSD